jgi:hypothetical protein
MPLGRDYELNRGVKTGVISESINSLDGYFNSTQKAGNSEINL